MKESSVLCVAWPVVFFKTLFCSTRSGTVSPLLRLSRSFLLQTASAEWKWTSGCRNKCNFKQYLNVAIHGCLNNWLGWWKILKCSLLAIPAPPSLRLLFDRLFFLCTLCLCDIAARHSLHDNVFQLFSRVSHWLNSASEEAAHTKLSALSGCSLKSLCVDLSTASDC